MAYGAGDLKSFSDLAGMLVKFDDAGGNVAPYVKQVFGRNQATIAARIKAYKGTSRDEGQTTRAAWLRRMGDLTLDLDGLRGLAALWRDVLAAEQPKAA